MSINENALESALRAAANTPATRPDFYRVLIDSEVFIISGDQREFRGRQTINAGEKINIQNWERADGGAVIPFFTSIGALQRAIVEPCSYLGLPAKSLFELTKGATLVLNPKLEYGKEFSPNEIEALLASGVTRVPEQRVTQKATTVLLGQPTNYPARMVGALTDFLSTRSQVKSAYLLLMHDPSCDEKPHLVVGVQVEGGIEHLFREAGVVAADTAPDGEPVDLYRVESSDKGLSEYFLSSVKPFYERTWSTKLKGLLGAGKA